MATSAFFASPCPARSRSDCCCAPRAKNSNPPVGQFRPLRQRGADQSIRNPETAMQDQLIIFDTTMRDGEQSPGAAMTRDEKERIAKQLERLLVDVIEAGFAASCPGDFDSS